MSTLALHLALAAHAADLAEQHVVDVLLHSEYGDSRNFVVRWTELPTLQAIGGTAAARGAVEDAIVELNGALSPLARRLELVEFGAEVQIYLTTSDAMPALAEANGFRFVPGNEAFFWVFWDERGAIYRGTVLVAEDLVGPRLRHVVLEELTQCLGMLEDSPLFPDSVVYESPTARGDATELSDLDRRMLLLLYTRLEPGDSERQVRRAWRRSERSAGL